MKSLDRIARTAGLGYLIIFITGFFANFFVLEGLVVDGDAAATFANIGNNPMQFRWGILSFLVMVMADVLLAWPLYLLLRPVNEHLSLLSAWLRLVNGAIFGVALVNLFGVLRLFSGAEYLATFETATLQARTMLLLDAFNYTWLIGLAFFGLHLLVLGYLVFRSGYFPKVLGLLLQLAALGYLTDSFAQFLLLNYADYKAVFEMIVVIPGVVGEFSFTVWLLVKGVKSLSLNQNKKGPI
ncbi:MAG: DUF4386 domain-containing protein [Lewinellaceae bacterium]|nr:DUF4386 domain-containing protein [Phaeodactylibacter sp.]MCB0615030.1 DUF4386 domain-containing protein [Phaeodactylibacter sp.]MCB9347342.1 DUF4386 domain-containing protein [Lewinellaceae bacterium]